ncbi:hypothetical protein AMEX_G22846 [Astyanax mexicanus]|uniref:Uncharacterized protein n=1 Tax=Astyanax mexicanus TaxID=7994 RepID=A0A8T2L0D0_ASTMX|nr:hypothetical protein AMEX_G22846 [Astyanax mexicanus]
MRISLNLHCDSLDWPHPPFESPAGVAWDTVSSSSTQPYFVVKISPFYVLAKFNLPDSTSLRLKDSSNVEVDSDIFDELLKSSGVFFKAEECNGIPTDVTFLEGSSSSDWSPSPSCVSQGSSSGTDSTVILESTKTRRRQLIEGPLDGNVARDVS